MICPVCKNKAKTTRTDQEDGKTTRKIKCCNGIIKTIEITEADYNRLIQEKKELLHQIEQNKRDYQQSIHELEQEKTEIIQEKENTIQDLHTRIKAYLSGFNGLHAIYSK